MLSSPSATLSTFPLQAQTPCPPSVSETPPTLDAASAMQHSSSTTHIGAWPPLDPFASPAIQTPSLAICEQNPVTEQTFEVPTSSISLNPCIENFQAGDLVQISQDAERWDVRSSSSQMNEGSKTFVVAFPKPIGCKIVYSRHLVPSMAQPVHCAEHARPVPANTLKQLELVHLVLNDVIRDPSLQLLCVEDKTQEEEAHTDRRRDRHRARAPTMVYVVLKEDWLAVACDYLQPRAIRVKDALRVASLTTLCLKKQNITGIQLKAVLPSLFKGECMALRQLDLSYNPLQDLGASALATLITEMSEKSKSSQTLCELEALDVSHCMIWTKKMTVYAQGCIEIVRAVRKSSHIKSLCMAGNDAGIPTCVEVAEMLASNTSLCELDLSSAGIACAGLEVIANALPHNLSLLSLHLGGNNSPETKSFWQAALRQNPYIQHISLPVPCPSQNPLIEAKNERIRAQIAQAFALPQVDLQLALCMGMHKRLGQRSYVCRLSDGILYDIIRLSARTREVVFE